MNPFAGSCTPTSALGLRVTRHSLPARELSFAEIFRLGFPHAGLTREVFMWRLKNLPNLWRGLWRVGVARFFNINTAYGTLGLTIYRTDGSVVPLGIASLRVVTTTGVDYIRDAFLGSVEAENMKYHGFGTGTGAEAVGDTALGTELTTEYVTNSTRPTGSQVSGGSGAYQTVGTLAPDSGGTLAITEHGIFSQAATGGGVLLDRSKFSAVNLVAGSDSLAATYTITFASGG